MTGADAYAEVLTLTDGLRIATENGRLIKIAESEEGISEADALILRSKMLPDVNASLNQTFLASEPGAIFGRQFVPTAEKSFFSYSLSVQQTLYDFKRSSSRYEAGRLVLNSKKMETRRIRNLLAVDFVLAYLNLLESEKLVFVAEKEVEGIESHLSDAKNFYEAGVITKNDLLQAEVKISDARQRLLNARNLRAMTASRLNNLLQRQLKADIKVADIETAAFYTPEPDLQKAWEIAEKQRAELQIIDEILKSLDLEITARRSEYYPKIFVRGAYDFAENPYQLHEGNWSLTLGVGINLFNGGGTTAEESRVEYQRQKLIEQRRKLIDEIRLEVDVYMLELTTAGEKISVTTNAVRQAEENLRINRIKYEAGAGTSTDVLDAVSLLTVAETNYNKAVYDRMKSEAAVLYSMGKDLTEVYK